MDSGASFDGLVDLFESMTIFLRRLEIYIKIPPTVAMTEIVVKIMIELFSTLALVTKQIGQGQLSASPVCYLTQHGAEKIGQRRLEENQFEAVLQRLDRLTQDEARTTAAQTLQIVYGLVQDVRVFIDGE
jgi:hypothetical protein